MVVEGQSMDSYKHLFLGGGMVAGYALKELAARGHLTAGEAAIISADAHPPYERPPLSKGYLAGSEDEASVFINPPDFYQANGVAVRLNTVVERIDPSQRRVVLTTGEEVGYESLVIATGATPRKLNIPGNDLEGIHYLRSLDDSGAIRHDATGRGLAIVIGGGFIAMEVSAVLAAKGIAPSMLFPEDRVWQRLFTPAMSEFFTNYFVEHGVMVRPHHAVTAFEGDRRVHSAVMANGDRIPGEIVIVGAGVTLETAVVDGSGVQVDNGIVVNEYLETSVPGIYAAGDVANYNDMLFARRRRIEHWDNAVEQGKHIARVISGEREPFLHVPYFFSDAFDLSYEYWGDATGATEARIAGSTADGSFSTWWIRDETVIAAFVLNRPDAERDLAQQVIREKQPLPREIHAIHTPLS
jgi:NADPH-dependent 2,4-dienoyl-CoA reductase/sulfur reductase-like enzyme